MSNQFDDQNSTGHTGLDIEIIKAKMGSINKLKPFQNLFLDLIAPLEDDFIKKAVADTTVLTLQKRIKYEKYMATVKDLAINDTSIPRSIQVNIKLTCAEDDVMKSEDFNRLAKEAEKCIADWQKKMKTLFRQAKELDRNHARLQVMKVFFKEVAKLINLKAQFLLDSNLSTESKKLFNKDKQLLASAAWFIILNKYHSEFPDADFHVNNQFVNNTDTPTNWLYDLHKSFLLASMKEVREEINQTHNSNDAVLLLLKLRTDPCAEHSKMLQDLISFICDIIPKMTTQLHRKYKEQLLLKEARKIANATYNSETIRSTTNKINEALAAEQSINSTNMDNLITKKVNQEVTNRLNKINTKQNHQTTTNNTNQHKKKNNKPKQHNQHNQHPKNSNGGEKVASTVTNLARTTTPTKQSTTLKWTPPSYKRKNQTSTFISPNGKTIRLNSPPNSKKRKFNKKGRRGRDNAEGSHKDSNVGR